MSIKFNEIDSLYLQENFFSGSIPSWIGSLSLLEHLNLGMNEFSGVLPIEICDLVNLERLMIFENSIEGTTLFLIKGFIPACIGSLNLLELIDLSDNEFSGELPIEICDLVNLHEIWIYDNSIDGSIPACIGALTKLLYLDLALNKISGKVPESIGQLILLRELYLGFETDSNLFVGPLPSSMNNLDRLRKLYLNVATWIGPLPDLSQLTSLTHCAFAPLQMCILSGFVPEDSKYCDFSILSICKFRDCEILEEWLPNVFDAHTCCQVDGVTCEEYRVVILDLSSAKIGRKISGIIPITVGELDKLEQLYLQDNILKGNLPLSMSNISFL
jgi:Leucine-rich repeat (LRR) protein